MQLLAAGLGGVVAEEQPRALGGPPGLAVKILRIPRELRRIDAYIESLKQETL